MVWGSQRGFLCSRAHLGSDYFSCIPSLPIANSSTVTKVKPSLSPCTPRLSITGNASPFTPLALISLEETTLYSQNGVVKMKRTLMQECSLTVTFKISSILTHFVNLVRKKFPVTGISSNYLQITPLKLHFFNNFNVE